MCVYIAKHFDSLMFVILHFLLNFHDEPLVTTCHCSVGCNSNKIVVECNKPQEVHSKLKKKNISIVIIKHPPAHVGPDASL